MLSERPWKLEGIIRLMAGILVCICCVVVVQTAVQHFTGTTKFADGSLLYELFSSLALHGSILAGTAFFVVSQDQRWSDYFGFSRQPARAVAYGALATVCFIPVGIVLQEASVKLITVLSHQIPDKQAAVVEFGKAVTWPSRAYFVFFAVVLAPIAEEILFRGIIFAILRQAGFPRVALWISAVLFAASHEQQIDKSHFALAAVFVPLLVLGLLFAWLYEKTDNLLASISAHSLFNAINLVFLFAS